MKAIIYISTDIREEYCFTTLVRGQCLIHSAEIGRTTKGRCCCGLAAAWGPHCEVCPSIGTGTVANRRTHFLGLL